VKPLFARQRRALIRLAMPASVASLAILPLTFPPELQAQGGGQPIARANVPDVPQRLVFPSFGVRRDPFAAPVETGGSGAASGVAGQDGAVVVRAIVFGTPRKALVDVAGQPRVVGTGSPLSGSVVVRIEAGGVVLADGRVLRYGVGELP
jgi:hypothetical protein